uniref:Uncharacterized protein n=1 Tax=Mucochytrium quahogii TaxID=96639 RepID=A0A7S2RJV7_9STRA|mmetsp:Transcript_14488/g.25481  ORF Transcript_14488/g.25481 Transcript_14488/m.25481 type:complete len:363 (+) Transcript_14488:235-1323(+)
MSLHRACAELTRMLASNLPKGELKGLAKTIDPETARALQVAREALEHVQTVKEETERRLDEEVRQNEKLKQGLSEVKTRCAELEQEKRELQATKKAEARVGRHPIYGQLVHDFGYKKVYASEPKRLVDKIVLPVWERQRTFRPERAKAIAEAKTNDDRFGLPGVISVYDVDQWDKRGIVDGQHRIGGLELLLRGGKWKEDTLVLTEVFPVGDSDKDVKDLFLEINQAQPAMEIDLPGAVEDERIKTTIDDVCARFAKEYPEMFKPSARCRPPHLNIDVFRQEVFQSEKLRKVIFDAVSKDGETAAETVYTYISDMNDELSKLNENEWGQSHVVKIKNQQTLKKAVTKCKKNKFYLGLDTSWY